MSPRRPYHAKAQRSHRALGVSLLCAGLLLPTFGGCISIPLAGLDDGAGPAVTGSLRENVEIADQLPQTLAYSDAVVIGQVTARKILDAVSDESVQWSNGSTGSVGTWVPTTDPASGRDGTCRSFGSTVTSLKGVHRYSGHACKGKDGRTIVRSLAGIEAAES